MTALAWALASLALAAGALPAATRASAEEGSLRGKLSRAMHAAGGQSGVAVIDATAGTVLFERRAAAARAPASNQKLLTSIAVLDRFGPRARRRTVAYAAGTRSADVLQGDLYLKGYGDPSFGSSGFVNGFLGGAGTSVSSLAAKVRATGLRRITGRVYGDETYFDTRRGVPGTGYAASGDLGPLSALAFNRGIGRRGFQRRPAVFAATQLARALRAQGVKVRRAGSARRLPDGATPLARVSSPPLARLLVGMNKRSDNYYAELLAKNLGKVHGKGGTTAAGAKVMRGVLGSFGVGAAVADGSGLSRANRIAPRALARLLQQARQRDWFDSLYVSLPVAGRDGTLGARMRGTAAAGRVHAKTGTLSDASALSGYVRSRGGDVLVFSILMNRVSVFRARRAQDRMAVAMAAYRGDGGGSDHPGAEQPGTDQPGGEAPTP